MPWSQTSPMDQRTQFIADYLRGCLSITDLCHFKGLYDEMGGARRQARHFGVLSVLTSRGCDGGGNRRTYLLSLICIKPRRSARIHRFGQTPGCPTRREWPDAATSQPCRLHLISIPTGQLHLPVNNLPI